MTAPSGVRVRPAEPDDRAFLFEVYAGTRTEELAQVPWTDEQRVAFLWQQFSAQDASYRERYPDADFSIVELDGTPIGRLYVTRLERGEIRIVDIALVAHHRRAGIGRWLLDGLIATADRDGVMVSLHVEHWNPALQLYERLGFVRAAANDVYVRMERAAVS